jgi:hypothetical protein
MSKPLTRRSSNTYERVYAAARQCNGEEFLSVAGLSSLPYWELFLEGSLPSRDKL